MYSTRIIDTADPDQFVACGRPATDLTITEPGRFSVHTVRMNLQHVWAQRVHERLACLKRVELARNCFLFHAEPGPSMVLNGAEIEINQVAVLGPGDCYNWRLAGATHWGGMSLTNEDMDALFGSMPVRGVSVFTPPPAALARLRLVHECIGRLAETTSELQTHIDLAHDVEQALISAVQELRNTQASGSDTLRRRQHQIVVNRFRAIIEAQADQPLYMSEISRRIGVSSRTLRAACHEQLGVSPFQYVMLRRMQTVRRALQKADPDITRVTDIAMEHGFWELGRFAVKYRHVFGETPSATLRA